MKTTVLTTAALLTAMTGLAIAKPIPPQPERVERVEQPQDEVNEKPKAQARQAPLELIAYLGVGTEPMPERQAAALGLKPATALRVTAVQPDTAADLAGLKAGDVLTHLDDQLLITPRQLSVLIQNHKPGDKITLKLLRDGKALSIKATLGERQQLRQFQRGLNGPIRLAEDEMIPEQLLRQMLNDQIKLQRLDGPEELPRAMREMIERMQEQQGEMRLRIEQMQRDMKLNPDIFDGMPPIGQGMRGMRSVVSINDGKHSLKLVSNGQDRELTVKDKDGKVLFDGQLPEDGQVEGLAKEVQEKVDKMLNSNRIRIEIQPAPAPQPQADGPVT